ncbi:MAG: hypothetical protein KKC20_23010 [Proteobacteria bacterium]|nr:hypothetical protein [Pseudomonadota bacterium]
MNEKIDPPKKRGADNFMAMDGKLFFTKQVEQKVFFAMTMIMLLAGILAKIGLF